MSGLLLVMMESPGALVGIGTAPRVTASTTTPRATSSAPRPVVTASAPRPR